jgi:hypothetical protein
LARFYLPFLSVLISGFHHKDDYSWSSSDENVVIAQRSLAKIHANFKVLENSAALDSNSSSAIELAKFGFDRSQILGIKGNSNFNHSPPVKENVLRFGSFSDPIMVDPNKQFSEKFIGSDYMQDFSRSLSAKTLLHIQDMRQAGYADSEIMQSLKIPLIPPDSVVTNLTNSSSNFGLNGPSVRDGPSNSVACAKCLAAGHAAADCIMGWRCRLCHQLGHISRTCYSK